AGAVTFAGTAHEMIRANIHLRCAGRVLVPIVDGPVTSPDELYRLARRLSWSAIIPPPDSFRVSAFSSDPQLPDGRFAALKVKDAIADSQRAKRAERSNVDKQTPTVGVSVHIANSRAQISLDSSWPALHERGYRTEGGTAPLRETLAAALVMLSGWDTTLPLCDPMCGSGTIAIEAAMIERSIAPGLLRPGFAYQRWRFVDPGLHERCIAEARRAVTDSPSHPRIYASDIDPAIVAAAMRNADRAGVADSIEFSVTDLFARDAPAAEPGIVVTNPPYGERMSLDEADSFYRDLGDRFKRGYAGWQVYLLTSNRAAMKRFGLRTNVTAKLRNGPIDTTFYATRIFPRTDDARRENSD
ncbi:MAG: RNA methyltransferase, partial [Spirochaetaceae bacterium]